MQDIVEWDRKEQTYKKKIKRLDEEVRTLKENQQVSDEQPERLELRCSNHQHPMLVANTNTNPPKASPAS